MKEKKCIYCNKKGSLVEFRFKNKILFVHEEHYEVLRKFIQFSEKYKYLFAVILLGIALFSIVIESKYQGILVSSVGVTILIFPFSTPQTVNLFGVRASIYIARLLAFILIGLGLKDIFA